MDFKIVIFVSLAVVDAVNCHTVGAVDYISIDAINTMFRGDAFQAGIANGLNFTVPILSGEITSIFGRDFRWKLTDWKGATYSTPFIHITSSNSDSVAVSITGASVKFSGTVLILKNGKPIIRQTINGAACLEGHITFSEEPGQDVMDITECTCTASCGGIQLNLTFDGMIPKFIQHEIDSTLEDIFEKHLDPLACGYVRSFNLSTSNFYSGGPLTEVLYLQFKLVKKLETRNRGIIAYGSGNVIPRDPKLDIFGDNGMVGTQLPDITPYIQPNKSMQILLSNYTLSTFVYTAIKLRLLDTWVHANSLSPVDRTFFATECNQVCFGTKFPQLKSKFPGKFVDAHLVMQDNVMSYFTEDFASLHISITGEFVIGNYSFLTLSADLSMDIVPFIENSTQILKGKLLKFDIVNQRIVSSSVGDAPSVVLCWIFDVLKNVDLHKRTSGYLMEGMDLKTLGYHRGLPGKHPRLSFTIRDAEFKLHKDFLYTAGNVYLN